MLLLSLVQCFSEESKNPSVKTDDDKKVEVNSDTKDELPQLKGDDEFSREEKIKFLDRMIDERGMCEGDDAYTREEARKRWLEIVECLYGKNYLERTMRSEAEHEQIMADIADGTFARNMMGGFNLRPEDLVKDKEKNNPDWKVESKFDEKTGIVTISIIPISGRTVIIDVARNFVTERAFNYKGFDIAISDESENNKDDEDLKKILKSLNSDVIPREKIDESRSIVLKKGEKYLRDMYIWEVKRWDELCDVMKKNHNLKLELRKTIRVTIEDIGNIPNHVTIKTDDKEDDDSELKKTDSYLSMHTIIVPINYNIINRIIKVKEKYDSVHNIKEDNDME
jgi:hypothetical protein